MPSAAPKQHWTSVVAENLARRDALFPQDYLVPADQLPPKSQLNVIDFPKTCGVLTHEEVEITETNGPALVRKMVAGELSSVDVTRAFCKRATIAHQLTNCLTEILFEQALEAAAQADKHLTETSEPLGPLHGLPVSLKDNFNIAGVDTTVGFVAWIGDPVKAAGDSSEGLKESEMTKIMRDSGAILFCKTNVPVAMMIAESHNNVWGYTTNPYNRALSSGGSSGGEGALLALKGSPLGIGTDIGGSIRIPSAFCGLYGLKPSYGRFATLGARSGMPGQEAVRSINGPMSSSLEAVKLWAKTVVDDKPWEKDPGMIPIPWRQVDVKGKRLSFGIIMDDGIVAPTPPVLRALRETKAALEKAGHEVVEWKAYDPAGGVSLLERFFVGDGGVKIASTIAQSGETWVQGLEAYSEAYEASKHVPRTVGDLWSLQAERSAYVKRALDAWMATAGLTSSGLPFDAVISPATAYAACPQHTFQHVGYTCLWNITDQSACVFPVTQATSDDTVPSDFTSRNEKEKSIWDRYDPEEVAGAPVALQLIGQRLEEEKVLAIVEVIADCLKA